MSNEAKTVGELAKQDEKTGRTWLVLDRRYGTWGAGVTLDAAMKNNRAQGGSAREVVAHLYAHEAHAEVVVSSDGGIVTRTTQPGRTVSFAEIIETVRYGKNGRPLKLAQSSSFNR